MPEDRVAVLGAMRQYLEAGELLEQTLRRLAEEQEVLTEAQARVVQTTKDAHEARDLVVDASTQLGMDPAGYLDLQLNGGPPTTDGKADLPGHFEGETYVSAQPPAEPEQGEEPTAPAEPAEEELIYSGPPEGLSQLITDPVELSFARKKAIEDMERHQETARQKAERIRREQHPRLDARPPKQEENAGNPTIAEVEETVRPTSESGEETLSAPEPPEESKATGSPERYVPEAPPEGGQIRPRNANTKALWRALRDEPRTADELSELTGLGNQMIYATLQNMRKRNLVHKQGWKKRRGHGGRETRQHVWHVNHKTLKEAGLV